MHPSPSQCVHVSVSASVSGLAGFHRVNQRRRQAGAQVCSENVLVSHVPTCMCLAWQDSIASTNAAARRAHRSALEMSSCVLCMCLTWQDSIASTNAAARRAHRSALEMSSCVLCMCLTWQDSIASTNAAARRAHRSAPEMSSYLMSPRACVCVCVSVSDLAGFRRVNQRRRLAGVQVCPVLRVCYCDSCMSDRCSCCEDSAVTKFWVSQCECVCRQMFICMQLTLILYVNVGCTATPHCCYIVIAYRKLLITTQQFLVHGILSLRFDVLK